MPVPLQIRSNRIMDAHELGEKYHTLDPNYIDDILTEDFRGRHPMGYTWDMESHRLFVSDIRAAFPDLVDEIHGVVVEGDHMAIWFTRYGHQDGTWCKRAASGKEIRIEICHFATIRGGKIAEVIEFFDHRQLQRFFDDW